jgi:hypothetical protein
MKLDEVNKRTQDAFFSPFNEAAKRVPSAKSGNVGGIGLLTCDEHYVPEVVGVELSLSSSGEVSSPLRFLPIIGARMKMPTANPPVRISSSLCVRCQPGKDPNNLIW